MSATFPGEALIGNWPAANCCQRPLPLRDLSLSGFLGDKVDRNAGYSIPLGWQSPIAEPFRLLARGRELLPVHCRLAAESDLYKLLEGACYAFAATGEDDLKDALDTHLSDILARQEKDGYIGLPNRGRLDTAVWHELYIAGHFMEMAVAHRAATGEDRALEAACRLADWLISSKDAGHAYFAGVGDREHPGIEVGLVRLYRATGDRRYLDFAAWNARQYRLGDRVADIKAGGGARHAVRVPYLLTGMAELFLETGDDLWLLHLQTLWQELIATRTYLTGGIGENEIIPILPWQLHQTGRIAETCASIAMMMLALRLNAIYGEAACFDMVETILYNHFLGALNTSQDAVFYYNPIRLSSEMAQSEHSGGSPFKRTTLPDIHRTSCCFPNVWRWLGQLPEYVFACDGRSVSVNLYTTAAALARLSDGREVNIRVDTAYPWDESIRVSVSGPLPVRLRIPSWCSRASIHYDGREMHPAPGDYYDVDMAREGSLLLRLPVEPEAILSSARITDNTGQIAFRMGPTIFCYEPSQEASATGIDGVCLPDDFSLDCLRDGEKTTLKVDMEERLEPQEPYFGRSRVLRGRRFQGLLTPFRGRGQGQKDNGWTVFLPAFGCWPR